MKKGQVILLATAVVLGVLLMLANTTPPAKQPEAVQAQVTAGDNEHFAEHVQASIDALGSDRKETVHKWEKLAESDPSGYDSLVSVWGGLNKPEVAAYYSEKVAEKRNTRDAWVIAGNRYYAATGFVNADERGQLYVNAIRCFTKAQDLAPNDLDIQTSIAACYVEGTADPMKGIGLLRDVIAKDSANVSAQLQLALFSVKSNQFDKAIMRFKKVLELDPTKLDAYLYLADVYEQTGDKANAIKNLEKYRDLVTDITVKTEVQGYIDKLKNSN